MTGGELVPRSRPRSAVVALVGAVFALWSAPANAYSLGERFDAPVVEGGGAGRWFTGSIADGFDCGVCHGEAPTRIFVDGVPEETYEPGAVYEIGVGWPEGLHAMALEIVDEDGARAGALTLREPTEEERCGPDNGTQVWMASGTREVAFTNACGAARASLTWTAPRDARPVWVHAMVVRSNGSGDPSGDGVDRFRRALAVEGTPPPVVSESAGCAASRGASGAWVLFLLLLARRRLRRRGELAVMVVLLASSPAFADDEIGASLYVRTDTDDTTVVSPKVRARVGLGDRTTVEAGYAADIWTGASIDVRTMATRAIHEQRDELTAGLAYELDDVTLRADYRFSTENDYTSHGGSVDGTWRFAGNNATLRARLLAAQDVVSRSGDETFRRRLSSLGAHLVFTQNLDPRTLVQVAYELTRREGYQASPYRFVGVGGDGFGCRDARLCLPEAHPEGRIRHAAVVRGRRAFGESASAGLLYRFYADDWGLRSHTATLDVGWVPGTRTLVRARYRFYQQNGASFYRSRYEDAVSLQFATRDRELSPLLTNRLQLSVERSVDLTSAGPEMKLTFGLSGTHLHYQDFVGLSQVWALDVTVAAVVVL